ncbi:MAG: transglycosylase SLT domain-containing protein [Proteobacteria bacterium]|nr:transglycosylase SLT domain-containing protein [Pseudomonadota bacterium]MBU1594258.1 transglycosylase SLT domain-containing protein [Pseudomonadota bacterium]
MQVILAVIVLAYVLGFCTCAHAASIPPQAERYRPTLVRSARFVFGMSAPVAVLAAQVHQESAWNPHAHSAYASGLAQFTPATVDTMRSAYAPELGGLSRAAAPLDPRWALLALCRYDARLLSMFTGATPADRWAFALAAYNGGPGWIIRDRALARAQGLDHQAWFGQVEAVNAGRAPQFFRENRDYPRRILLRHQALYRPWGPGVHVAEVAP